MPASAVSVVAVWLSVAAGVEAGAEAGLPKLAVLPMTSRRVPDQVVQVLDELLVSELDRRRTWQIITTSDMNAMLGLEKMKEAMGCSDLACAAEIGGALGVDLMVTGSVGRLGDELLVQVSLIDAKRATVQKRGRGTVKDDEKLYRHAVELAVAELLGEPPPKPASAAAPPPAAVEPKAPDPGPTTAKLSPTSVRFVTSEEEFPFEVELTGSDGRSHLCAGPIDPAHPCTLTGIALGDGFLRVRSGVLSPLGRSFELEDGDKLMMVTISEMPSAGSIVAWALGGTGMAVGASLLGIGAGMEKPGLAWGGTAVLVGSAIPVVLAFFFDGQVVAQDDDFTAGLGLW